MGAQITGSNFLESVKNVSFKVERKINQKSRKSLG